MIYSHEFCDGTGPDCSPDCRADPTPPWRERAVTGVRLDRLRQALAAGRCTLRASECGWDFDGARCVKHHGGAA